MLIIIKVIFYFIKNLQFQLKLSINHINTANFNFPNIFHLMINLLIHFAFVFLVFLRLLCLLLPLKLLFFLNLFLVTFHDFYNFLLLNHFLLDLLND